LIRIARPRVSEKQKQLAKEGDLPLDQLQNSNWVKVLQSSTASGSSVIYGDNSIDSSKLCYSLEQLPIKVER